MPIVKWLAGLAPEVNLMSGVQAIKHASEIHPGRRHQKSKRGVSVAPQKGHVFSKKFKKERKKEKTSHLLARQVFFG